MLRALLALVRSRRRIEHVPTLMRVRAMAHFNGREPSSHLLDPAVNFVPERPLGGGDLRGGGTPCASRVNTPAVAGGSSWFRCPTRARSACSA